MISQQTLEKIGRPGKPMVWREARGHYTVQGASGEGAGSIERRRRYWIVRLHGQQPEFCTSFNSARAVALSEAERY